MFFSLEIPMTGVRDPNLQESIWFLNLDQAETSWNQNVHYIRITMYTYGHMDTACIYIDYIYIYIL